VLLPGSLDERLRRSDEQRDPPGFKEHLESAAWNVWAVVDGAQDESEACWIQDAQAPYARTTLVPGITTPLMLLMAPFLQQEGRRSILYHMFLS
jgi:hypothetical protein